MTYSNSKIQEVSDFLQNYMRVSHITELTADKCADILAEKSILSNEVKPQPGFNFRQMLRDGRDRIIPLIEGAYQEAPRKPWRIFRLDAYPSQLKKEMEALGIIYIDSEGKTFNQPLSKENVIAEINNVTDRVILSVTDKDVSKINFLNSSGFINIGKIEKLMNDGYPDLRELDCCGVYAISKPEGYLCRFITPESLEIRNVINPWTLERLAEKWIPDSEIVYYGLAGGENGRVLLNRLNELIEHGKGNITDRGPHKGGEIFWQLSGYTEFEIWILPYEKPIELEKTLLKKFIEIHGKLPFANRRL